jgi:hypothetical protein
VRLAGGAESSDLGNAKLIDLPSHWTAHDRDADHVAFLLDADGEPVTANGPVVPMMLIHVGVGPLESEGDHFHRSLQSGVARWRSFCSFSMVSSMYFALTSALSIASDISAVWR